MNRHRKKRRMKRRPINVLASALTSFGLYCGIASIFASFSALLARTEVFTKDAMLLDDPTDFQKFAASLIFFALIFDMLDGTVAKLTHSTSEFGKQLDSLCDLVSFGVAPGVLVFSTFLEFSITEGGVTAPLGSVLAVIFVLCGALRLARFNVYQSDRRDYFTGLPIPAAGITIASFTLFRMHVDLGYWALWTIGPLALLLAYLMVSTLRYPKDKMKSMVLAPGHAMQLLVLCAIGIAVFDFASARSPALVLFPLTLVYVLFGVGDYLYSMLRHRPHAEPEPISEEKPQTP